MTTPEDGGQAQRRTASGVGLPAPLNLIHRNKVPNPMPMRVSGRFSLENLTPVALDSWLDFLDFLAGPIGALLLQRRTNAR